MSLLLHGNKFRAVPSAFDQFLGFLAGSTVTILSFDCFAFDIGSRVVLGGWIGHGLGFLKHPLLQLNRDISEFYSWLQEPIVWRLLWLVFFLGTLNCNPFWMLLASKIRRCIEQIIQCPLILTLDSIQPGLQHGPVQSTSNDGFWWILYDIVIITYYNTVKSACLDCLCSLLHTDAFAWFPFFLCSAISCLEDGTSPNEIHVEALHWT